MAVHSRPIRVLLAFLMLSACGGGRQTLGEYSEAVAEVIGAVDARLDAHANQLFAGTPDLGDTRAYLAARIEGYEEMLSGVRKLDPPEVIEELHDTFVVLLDEILEGERARAEYAATLDVSADPRLIWESDESAALRAVEVKVVDICHAAQDMVEETQQRTGAADVPWIPAEMKEVVRTAFGCPEVPDA